MDLYICNCEKKDDKEVCEYQFDSKIDVGLPEYCIDAVEQGYGADEDKDKKPNCLDTDCFGVKCSNSQLS